MKFDNKKVVTLLVVLVVAYYFLANKKPSINTGGSTGGNTGGNTGGGNVPKTLTNIDYADIIVRGGKAGSVGSIKNYDLEFLKAWAAAVKSGYASFEYNNKTYLTLGGRSKVLTKEDYAYIIVIGGKAESTSLIKNYDLEFLKAWAAAVKSGTESFLYNGKTYVTLGGKSKR